MLHMKLSSEKIGRIERERKQHAQAFVLADVK